VVAALAFAALLVVVLQRTDLPSAVGLLRRAPALGLALVPASLGVLCDVLGWNRLLAASGARLPIGALVETRLASEAVALSLPTGTVFGEATALFHMHHRHGVSLPRAAASLTSRRLFVIFAHGLSLGIASVIEPGALRRVWPAGWTGLGWALPISAVSLVAVTLVAPGLMVQGSLARRFPRFTRHLARSGTPAARPFSATTAAYVAMWALESVESVLILGALGASLGWAQIFAFDQLVILARSLSFFTPAGLGVQDIGYIALLSALAPGAAGLGAAFVIAKRTREVFFVALGYGILLSRTSPPASVAWSPS
jgi:uncharacterized membrane protein YbhN (UPF0104 family)